MGLDNGVIKIGRKGRKKFAFGEGPVFEVDVVVAFQQWIDTDEQFRQEQEEDEDGHRPIPTGSMPAYHAAAIAFVVGLGGGDVTTAEALDFIARLREQYDELAAFFRPRSPEERASPASTGAASALQFSQEPS